MWLDCSLDALLSDFVILCELLHIVIWLHSVICFTPCRLPHSCMRETIDAENPFSALVASMLSCGVATLMTRFYEVESSLSVSLSTSALAYLMALSPSLCCKGEW